MTNKFIIKWCCIVGLCLAQLVLFTSASAQSFDVEPPVIDHDVVESVEAAEIQTFSANVADDVELNSVRFLYRFEGESQFTSIDMEPVASSSTYSVQVETDVDDGRAIQYYFEARDVSGNRTLRGYNFSPLIRLIELPQVAEVPAADTGPKRTNRRPIYIAVGAVVAAALVGALVSGSGGGGGDGGPATTGDCDNGLCDFTLTINPPGQ